MDQYLHKQAMPKYISVENAKPKKCISPANEQARAREREEKCKSVIMGIAVEQINSGELLKNTRFGSIFYDFHHIPTFIAGKKNCGIIFALWV